MQQYIGRMNNSYNICLGVIKMSIKPEYITVPEDVQENYIIYDRELSENLIPEFDKNILVTNDHLSNRLFINIYYTFDDRDISNKHIYVKWVNVDNKSGISECVDKQLINDRLKFAWNVPIEATYKEGFITFSVYITDTNYEWNSLPTTVEVKQGLVTESFNNLLEEQAKPEWDEYIEGIYKTVCKTMLVQDYETLPTKSDNILYLVKGEKGVCLYIGELPVNNGILPYQETTEYDYIYKVVNNESSIILYKGTAYKPIIPNTLGGSPVTTIYATAFNESYVTGVQIPSTVTLIE